ncbi:hypothetical protein ACLB2K_053380 [Fragaria x ananassa]
MAGSSTSSLNARALALRTKTKEFLRKRGRSEVANEEASVGKAATPRRSPRSTKVVVVDQTSKDAPTKADVVLPRRSPRSTARTSKDALNNARVGPAKATQSKKSVASKKLSFGSMSNSGSGKRKAGKSKAGKSKAGTMEVVESDDEDEEFEADEDEEESNENVTGGMRLLRRGMVTMSRVNRRLVRGRKLKVKYNDDGEPVGRAAKEMQSYIGVFARTKVPINVKDWRLVPLSVKDNIWGSIEEAYVVPKQWKKMVFASAGQKWRDFKSKLTTWYIIPFMDSPELFEFPPDDYRSIHADQWQEFVKDRISPQFQEFRQKQMARRKENKYPHRLGRKPYAQLQEELAATVPAGRKLVRTTMWKAARQDKDGNYLAPQVQEKVDEIQAPRKYGRKKTKQWVDTDKDDDDLEHLPADLPPALLSLSKWGNEFLKDRATIHTKLSKDLFGTERKIALFRSDLFAFTNVQEVAGDTIVMYMSFLREKLKESNMLNMIGFVDPSSLGVGNSTDRSRSFSAALKRGKPGQFFLVPYNTGKHWILSVVSPSEELVYFMDPMKRRMDVTTDEWRTIVNQYGIPEQIGDKSCGYFIMLYMREIVQDKEQNWTKKWLTRGDEKYTMQDVDVVRQEWAEYVLKFTSN